MLDESVSSGILVWGISVPKTANGRRYWPDEIKAMAAERIDAGSSIVDVAREIGANESLVANWVRAASPKAPRPDFVELTPPRDDLRSRAATSASHSDLRIRIGDAEISVPPGYPAEQLAGILRAARAAVAPKDEDEESDTPASDMPEAEFSEQTEDAEETFGLDGAALPSPGGGRDRESPEERPGRPLSPRQLQLALRLAATFGTREGLLRCLDPDPGAVTLLGGMSPDDTKLLVARPAAARMPDPSNERGWTKLK